MRKDTVKKNEGSKAKGVLSAYNLFFMSSYRKTAAAILILLAVQAAVLIREMQGQKLYFESVAGGITLLPTLVGFIVLMYVLDDILGARKSNLDLTVRRLTIEPFSLFLTEAVYAMLVLFVYWALSAGLVYAAVGILAAVWTYNDEKEPSGEPTACSVGGDRKNVA